ncbi:hypothetical protein CPB85DRAFT_130490 [Mucidula mucida]|nr:hypothetical protein CPB85DRAFT_130490 [Mucidula mucida]
MNCSLCPGLCGCLCAWMNVFLLYRPKCGPSVDGPKQRSLRSLVQSWRVALNNGGGQWRAGCDIKVKSPLIYDLITTPEAALSAFMNFKDQHRFESMNEQRYDPRRRSPHPSISERDPPREADITDSSKGFLFASSASLHSQCSSFAEIPSPSAPPPSVTGSALRLPRVPVPSTNIELEDLIDKRLRAMVRLDDYEKILSEDPVKFMPRPSVMDGQRFDPSLRRQQSAEHDPESETSDGDSLVEIDLSDDVSRFDSESTKNHIEGSFFHVGVAKVKVYLSGRKLA